MREAAVAGSAFSRSAQARLAGKIAPERRSAKDYFTVGAPQDWMAANNDPAVKRAALIADEAVSALDVSVQPQVLELLDERLILILDAVIFVVEVCNKFDSCGTGSVYRCC
jgi:hypothetical protein